MQNTRGAAVWVLASFQNLFLEIIKVSNTTWFAICKNDLEREHIEMCM